jgi:hypothetical protein
MCQILSCFAFFVLEEWISAFVDKQLDELLIADTGGIVQGSDIIKSSCIYIRAVLDK